MGYTNLGLVKHAQAALKLNTKYMWGGVLKQITNQYITFMRTNWGNYPGSGYSDKRWEELKTYVGKNYYGCDCVGLIKSYYWSGKDDGGTGSPKYGEAGYPDVNANIMYNNAKVKGPISTLPEIPGLVVYCKTHPHVGVYIGNGWVIESTLGARGDGVVKTKLSAFKWEYWFECPYIQYTKTAAQVKSQEVAASTFKVGDKVKIKKTAKTYAGTKIAIPDSVKGKRFTVANTTNDKSLVKEIYSWVSNCDLERA